MKIDLKVLLIISQFILIMIFGYIWFYKKDPLYKRDLQELKDKYEEIKRQKDSISNVIDINERAYLDLIKYKDSIQTQINEYQEVISEIEKGIDEKDLQLKDFRKKLDENKKEIEKLKKNPIKREGSDLINNIKKNL